jgi:hypothetical protein
VPNKIQRDLAVVKAVMHERLVSGRREQELLDEMRKDAVTSINYRLEGLNEFRKQLDSMVGGLLSRIEYSNAHQALVAQIAAQREDSEKRFRALERLVWMAAGAVTIIAVLINLLRKP